MTVQITIIGLGQVGASIGMALGRQKSVDLRRVGYDRELAVQNKIKSLGAVDDTRFQLGAAVEGADIVLLCIPLEMIEETIQSIAPDLREGAVVMDFAPAKAQVEKWFGQHAAQGRYYIGLVPSVNPEQLDKNGAGFEAASADLFDKATIGIVAPGHTPAQVIKLADDFIRLLGAQALFLDVLEADGMMTSVHLLPQVLGVALLNSTVQQPGWTEARRFAGRVFARTSGAVDEEPLKSLGQAMMSNRESLLASLETVIASLYYLHKALKENDTADLENRLKLAYEDHATWLIERHSAKWVDSTAAREPMNSPGMLEMIFGSKLGGKKNQDRSGRS